MFDKVKCGVGIHKWSEWEYVSENSCNRTRHCLRCTAIETKEDDHSWGEWEYCIDTEKKEIQIKKDALLKAKDKVFNSYTSANDSKEKADNKRAFNEILVEIEKLELQVKKLEKISEPCKQIRICKICNEEQFRVKHNLTSPDYVSSSSCKIVSTCQNAGCSHKEYLEDKHMWGAWQYDSPDSCIQIRHCTRCSNREYTSDEKHIWSEWQVGSVPLDPCRIARYCNHCKKIEKKNEYQHNWGQWTECEIRKGNLVYTRQKICSRCNKSNYGTEHEGIMLTSGFYDHYLDIADYAVNFNQEYAKKHKKDIINAIEKIAEFNNKEYPSLEIRSLPGIVQIVEMLKQSSEEAIRIAAMKALMDMRKPADMKSEETLTTLFTIALTDSCKKVCTLSRSYLAELNRNSGK